VEKDIELYPYRENNLVTNRKGCELMRLSDLQPKKNYHYIFVQFPGMKMNVPIRSSGEEQAVKEDVALCVQLNSKEKVNDVYLVHTQSIKPFDFTEEGIGANASYRVIKQKENSPDSHTKEPEESVTFITNEVSIMQQKTEKGYHFILVVNNREMGMVASIEEEVLRTVKESLQLKEKVKEHVIVNTDRKIDMAVFVDKYKKRIIRGGDIFQDHEVYAPIRIAFEGSKRKFIVFSPAALDFIGPGDQNQSNLIMRRC